MRPPIRFFLALALALATATAWGAPGYQTQVRLLPAETEAKPGSTVLVGIELKMAPRIHTYWRNPGESGSATEVAWALPAGVTAGPLEWPVPERFATDGLVTFGYHDTIVLLASLNFARDVPLGPLILSAKVSWLECDEMCVPGRATATATIIVAQQSKASPNAPLLAEAQSRLPANGISLASTATWAGPDTAKSRLLILQWTVPERVATAEFLPYPADTFEIAPATELLAGSTAMARLQLAVTKSGTNWPNRIAGLIRQKLPSQAAAQVYEVSVLVGEKAPAAATTPAPAATAPRSLALMLLFAFLGGLILNIMPCVLPVIALKVLSFVGQSREAPARVRALGLVYGLGVLASFAVLALLAVAAQKAGGLASWGMLLQNPVFRVVMTVLITLVTLNLFGVFEVTLGNRVMGAADGLAGREGYPGAFFNGILATVLATPCTAPFLSAAVAFAFTQPPGVTLLVFLAVGLGLAAPFVLLCWQPAWLKLLPKPGAWMENFKTAMGFPMLATAVWIFWFTAPNYGESGVLWLGLFLVVVAAAAWVWGRFVQRGAKRRILAIVTSLALLALGYGFLLEGALDWRAQAATPAPGAIKEGAEGIDWQPWSPEALAKARAEGRPVLVDFTAKNCLTCQLNKRSSLEIPATRAKLKAIHAEALLGDFSNEDPRIAAELRRYDRPGVPLVLVYPRDADKPPIVLPPLLTKGLVQEALEQAAQ
jgi:thiol:disulfide interchange protein DsbD